jgi:cyclase
MNSKFIVEKTTRREMLRVGSGLAGAALASGILPAGLRAARFAQPRPWQNQQAGAPSNDRVAQMKAQAAGLPVQSQKLRDNIYMLSGGFGNIAILTGPEGKVMVDSGYSTVAPKVTAALAAIDAMPLKYLINTHWHFDHTDGNAAMHEAGATILAHENTLKRLSSPQDIVAFQMHFDAAAPAGRPRRTFTDKLTLYFEKEQVEMGYIPPAHTDGDIYVHFVKGNVLHAGDVYFNGFYPFIDGSTGGNINGMVEGSARCLAIADADTVIVPGHGPTGNKGTLTKYRDMLATVRDRVRAQKTTGKSLQQVVAAKPTADFDAEWGKGMMGPDLFVTVVYSTL